MRLGLGGLRGRRERKPYFLSTSAVTHAHRCLSFISRLPPFLLLPPPSRTPPSTSPPPPNGSTSKGRCVTGVATQEQGSRPCRPTAEPICSARYVDDHPGTDFHILTPRTNSTLRSFSYDITLYARNRRHSCVLALQTSIPVVVRLRSANTEAVATTTTIEAVSHILKTTAR